MPDCVDAVGPTMRSKICTVLEPETVRGPMPPDDRIRTAPVSARNVTERDATATDSSIVP